MKKSVNFWQRKLTLKVQFWHFWVNHNSSQDCSKEIPLNMLILGQKSCIVRPTIFEIPQPNCVIWGPSYLLLPFGMSYLQKWSHLRKDCDQVLSNRHPLNCKCVSRHASRKCYDIRLTCIVCFGQSFDYHSLWIMIRKKIRTTECS